MLDVLIILVVDPDLAIGTKSTFNRKVAESIIDVTFCGFALKSSLNWIVDDIYIYSDCMAEKKTTQALADGIRII